VVSSTKYGCQKEHSTLGWKVKRKHHIYIVEYAYSVRCAAVLVYLVMFLCHGPGEEEVGVLILASCTFLNPQR
jgi:hypothetical protein